MNTPVIHPNWELPPEVITDGFSIEMTAKDIEALEEAAPLMAPETPVSVTFLPGENLEMRIAAAKAVRRLGFEPMPHFSARRIASHEEFEEMARRVVAEADVKRVFVIAGDPPEAEGPFADTSAILATGVLEQVGIEAVGIGGHPDGHPNMTDEECWAVLQSKCADIESRGMASLIVTQFGFDPDRFLDWLKELLRFAARCGVGASASVMKKYGVMSLTNLMGKAGPDKMVDAFAAGLGPEHGKVRLHFYPFGGMKATMEWIDAYAASQKEAAA
jgi:methylenetetrahydrofolate reductase (NADPH)